MDINGKLSGEVKRFPYLLPDQPDLEGFQTAIIELIYEISSPRMGAREKPTRFFSKLMGIEYYHCLNRCENKSFGFSKEKQYLVHRDGNFSPEIFIEFVKVITGFVELTLDDLLRLAQAGGLSYLYKLFEDDWFKAKYFSKAIHWQPERGEKYPSPKVVVERPQLVNMILEGLEKGHGTHSLYSIVGSVGAGKTILLEQLANHPEVKNQYLVLWADFSQAGYRFWLRHWFRTFFETEVITGLYDSELIAGLKRQLRGKKCLVILDSVTDTSEVGPLRSVADQNRSIVVVSTISPYVSERFSIPKEYQYFMPGFSDNEVKSFYESIWGEIGKEDLAILEAINRLIYGNPLSLYFSCHLTARLGFRPAYDLLLNPTPVVVFELTKDILLPFFKQYEGLGELRDQIQALGQLPEQDGYGLDSLARVWDSSVEEARFWASRFDGFFMSKLENLDSDKWHVSPLIRAFARALPSS